MLVCPSKSQAESSAERMFDMTCEAVVLSRCLIVDDSRKPCQTMRSRYSDPARPEYQLFEIVLILDSFISSKNSFSARL